MNQPSARSASGSAESRLVLASRSPRRRRILSELGIEFELVAPEVEELTTGEPEALVLENARRKARAGRDLVAGEAMILGVDTDVALDGGLLGKAEDERGARERLEALSGRTHEVLSGLVLMTDAVTEVTFRKLDETTIGLYLRSGEWRDRAGAYAIQGLGSILVESLRGDFSNVVGLPVALLLQLAPNLLRLRPKH
jgi:septum formation protein